jgi:PAT family beta-lactamase induction signal transducer AmpG
MLSAWCIARFGLRRSIWPLTLLMNVNIWAYVALAAWRPDPRTAQGIGRIAGIHTYEMIAAGLGNSVLVVYLMRTCRSEYKAAHYAIGSALMSLGGTVLGGFGGIVVEQIGYIGLYLAGFALAIPGMLLIPWIPYLGQGPPSADSVLA